MQLVRGLYNVRSHHRPCVATIGNFDGVHLGHQRMLEALRHRAAALDLPGTVISFEPTPREYFAGTAAPPRLTRFREKFEALANYGVDRFVCLRFDSRMRSIGALAFIDEVLVGQLGVRALVVGHDFRFAHQREGTVELLQAVGPERGFEVEVVEPFEYGGERVSSSRVRAALAAGDLAEAARLLGRPYRITGRVAAGLKLGRRLGFPTANLRLHRRASPLGGVFAVRVQGGGLTNAPGVASLGTRPTVNGKEPLLEVHVFDFDGDLYRARLDVDFVSRLREERWFPSIDALVEQMRHDALEARRTLES
ncbi:MAG TPA: bifunctional riboflavin kinase/FAD synthetase [Steroidobacteraceae bacterium]|nr:bifunctional riboflavin kinase/FAD synthetase [Steroidobacteraceae bacterium]